MIPKHEDDEIWAAFESKWHFYPDYHSGMGIKEQGNYITIAISDLSTGQVRLLMEAQDKMIESIGYPVYAMDWQHESFKFDSLEESKAAPISIYPDGDYYIFVDSKAINGSFGHPWRQTICFFGTKVIDSIGSLILDSFTVIRKGTQQGAAPDAL